MADPSLITERVAAIAKQRQVLEETKAQAFGVLREIDPDLAGLALRVLETEWNAAHWMATPAPRFEGRLPYDLITEGHREQVIELLYAILHGFVY